MLDYDKVNRKILEIIGEAQYNVRLLSIAEMLDRLNPDTFPDGKGVEDFVAKVISDIVLGKRKASIGNNDVLNYANLLSLVDLTEHESEATNPENIKGVSDFTKVRLSGSKQHIVNLHERIEKVIEIRDQLLKDHCLLLTKMKSGKKKQTMNDWLSDLKGKTLDKDSEYLNTLIDECFEISKNNYIKMSTTDKIRSAVSQMELLELDCKTICLKYGYDFKNGNIRKFISRLKNKAKEA